jgi:hypothetical protein
VRRRRSSPGQKKYGLQYATSKRKASLMYKSRVCDSTQIFWNKLSASRRRAFCGCQSENREGRLGQGLQLCGKCTPSCVLRQQILIFGAPHSVSVIVHVASPWASARDPTQIPVASPAGLPSFERVTTTTDNVNESEYLDPPTVRSWAGREDPAGRFGTGGTRQAVPSGET